MKLTKPQLELLRFVRDHMSMPERNRGVGDRVEEMGLEAIAYAEAGR